MVVLVHNSKSTMERNMQERPKKIKQDLERERKKTEIVF